MSLTIVEEPPTAATFEAYASVPMAFEVDSRFRVEPFDVATGGFNLVLEPVTPGYVDDPDSDEGEHPTDWPKRWDTSRWAVFAAFDDSLRVGGAVVAFDTDDVWFLEGRKDIAALWDIRVAPDTRRGGIGKALFSAAAAWARERSCHLLKIETQDINVPACRFYAAMGCELGAVNRCFYQPPYADEVQFVWYLRLA